MLESEKMESVFVGEVPIDYNHFGIDHAELQKIKIGEIFQLKDSTMSMSCVNCLQEFQYFTEFSLHIQEHYMRGEIAQPHEIKEEAEFQSAEAEMHQNSKYIDADTAADADSDMPDDIEELPELKCEVIDNDEFDNFELDGWSDDEFDPNSHSIFDPDASAADAAIENKLLHFIEGTDYERVNNKYKCLTCDHENAKWKFMKEHLLIHSSPREVKCPLCSKLFATVSYVRKHCNRTHNVSISSSKIKEAQSTTMANAYDRPMPLQSLAKPKEVKTIYREGVEYKKTNEKFECLTCHRQMAKLDHMKEHLLTHTSEKNVYCPFCARAFITESYVRKHVNRTHKMKITTDEIKMAQSSIDVSQVKTQWSMEKDKNALISVSAAKGPKSSAGTSTTEVGTIVCLFCPKRFTKARYAQKHMRLIHAKPMTIHEVIKSQPKQNHEDEHDKSRIELETEQGPTTTAAASTERVKNFECFECHKQFVSLTSTRIHLKLHSGIKWSCPHCGKLFAMKSYVRDHIVIMHGIKRDDIPHESILQAAGDFASTSRPIIDSYECYLCMNKYKKRNRLREHMQTHLSGPYLCVICGAVYKSTDTLRHHMERHKANPDQPIKCPECHKTYPTRRYMLSHYRSIHLNRRRKKPRAERAFDLECSVCGKKFQNQHNLRQHLMVRL